MEIIAKLKTFPLVSTSDAENIVEGELENYFGMSTSIILDENASDEVAQKDKENFHSLRNGPLQEFLAILFSENLNYEPSTIYGSIGVYFNDQILSFMDDVNFAIDETKFRNILMAIISQATGWEIYMNYYDEESQKIDLHRWHENLKNGHYPSSTFPELFEEAEKKLKRYFKLDADCDAFRSQKNGRIDRRNGNPPLAVELISDTIGAGRSVKRKLRPNSNFEEFNLGHASVTSILEQHLPKILSKKHVVSLRNLTTQMKNESELHWHFCEDGILEITLNPYAVPRWLRADKIVELTFGEGYDGMSTDGQTSFERFYLYMKVRTTMGSTFTLYKYLSQDRQKATAAWEKLADQTLPKIAEFFEVSISNQSIDISKHYKTTTTYTTVWTWS